ncbi:ABC transporter substrate-binding protein [Halorubrum laminariae]|uniref:ABC transporter substrate-binding protein n=1 Tax=Halorubrum laminariae TaxID=1433523 RepID=A0ABD6BZI7_9EURY|nr:ABC transporter substrate-binding protein [Halorubrum laminariae]
MTRDDTPTRGDDTPTDFLTRRGCLRYGGALAGVSLAGCSGRSESGANSTQSDTADTGEASDAGDDTDDATASESDSNDGYAVTMAPMGTVRFEAPPESIFTRLTHLAGMAFALGRGDDVNAMHAPAYYDALWNQFTPRLDGVSLDWTGLYSSWNPSRETLYELNSDVHLADPASVSALQGWESDDVEAISDDIAPWFGNQFSDTHAKPPDEWADRYAYYDLWEMFERVSQVFQAEDRYRELAAVHDDLRVTIEANLPPADDRPRAVLIGASDLSSIYAYRLDDPGFLTAHTRPLKPASAFSTEVSSGDTVDMEALLEADPEAILVLGGLHPETGIESIRAELRDDAVGQQIDAVERGRVYAQGARYQGPVVNLFQLEMTAKQLYPDAFGAWPTYTEGPYPELPSDEQLFDRERVAAAITGDV